jgi:pilus assembly protein CpaB
MLASRQGTIAIALTVTVIAAAILVFALNRYKQSVDTNNAQSTVLVAASLIQKGTSGTEISAQHLYAPLRIIEKHVSTGAISDTAMLTGRVALTNILPGQQLTSADFAPTAGLASSLAANQRAISVPLPSSQGLQGVVSPGDHVDVYADFTSGGGAQLRLLIPNVLVLSTSAAGGGVTNNNGGSGNVLLAVNTNQAGKVAYASDNGKIWLVLRPGNAQNPTNTVATLQSILASPPPTGGGR